MYQVAVTAPQNRPDCDLDRLRTVAADLLREEGVVSAEVSVALIDGETMRRLNREHLGHDYDTDVLSFLLDCEQAQDAAPGLPRGQGKAIDGEILIGLDVAATSAADFGWPVENEVTLYLVHGLLHLAGYDDLSPDEKSLMRSRERLHLARWGLTPTYAEADPTDAT